jgi:hypothetical protein
MSEQPGNPTGPADEDEGSHASVGGQVDGAGGGRTEGETSVDEALGTGDDEAQ